MVNQNSRLLQSRLDKGEGMPCHHPAEADRQRNFERSDGCDEGHRAMRPDTFEQQRADPRRRSLGEQAWHGQPAHEGRIAGCPE
jgi:hypothetical protein